MKERRNSHKFRGLVKKNEGVTFLNKSIKLNLAVKSIDATQLSMNDEESTWSFSEKLEDITKLHHEMLNLVDVTKRLWEIRKCERLLKVIDVTECIYWEIRGSYKTHMMKWVIKIGGCERMHSGINKLDFRSLEDEVLCWRYR